MNRRTTSSVRRPIICASSIAAFLAAASVSPGTVYNVDLGDQLTEGANLSGGTNVQKTGYGTLFLTDNTNTHTGGTAIDLGAIVITGGGALGAGPVVVNGNVTTGQGGGQLLLGGTYGTQSFVLPATTLSGGGPSGNGLALMSVGNNNISGGIVTASTMTTRLGSSFGMMSVTGIALGAGQTTIVTSNLIANNTLTGVSGSGTLQKQGTSTLILTGSNTNTGIVDLNGGFVRVSAAANLGTSTAANAINFNNATLEVRTDAPDFASKGVSLATNNGTMNLDRLPGGSGMNVAVTFSNLTVVANRNLTVNSRNGYGATFNQLLGGAAGQNTVTNNGNGAVTFNGNVWSNSNAAAQVLTFAAANANSNIVLNGNIIANNTAAHSVAKTGTGTLTINSVGATYSGQTDIQNGTLTARTFRSIGNGTVGANILLGNAGNTGTLNFIGDVGTGAIPTPSIARNIILNGAAGGGRINANQAGSSPTALIQAGTITAANTTAKTLTLGGASALDNEISGTIEATGTNAVALTKTDSGTWVLSGANNYTGVTTVSGGTLKLKANAAASTVVNDASGLTFNVDAVTQAAGGNLTFVGQASTSNIENMGVLTPTQGAGTVTLSPGAGGTASMVFSSLGGTASSIASSVNIVAPTASDTVTITAQPTGFVRSNVYYNGGNFAYSAAGVLRAPLYGDGLGGGGTDIGFLTTAAGPMLGGLHNEITGSFSQATTTINSLKITGGQTLTLSGLLGIQNGSSTAGGIVMSGAAAATITGGSISQGSGAAVNGGAGLAVRVDDAAGSLTLQSPITNSTIGGLTKNGAGTLILQSNAHAYGGGTAINEGTLRLLGVTTVMGGANGVTTIRQGGTLDINAVNTGTRIGLLQGAGTITNTGSAAAIVTIGNGNGAGTWTGSISNGSGIAVTKAGTGSPTWNGASTYTGPTTILSTGIIAVPNLANIGTASGLGAGNSTNDATNSGSLLFGGASATFGTGGISYTGGNSISIDRLFTFAGSAQASGGRIQANGANNATLVLNKTNPILYTAGANTVAQTLTLGGASTGDNQINTQLVNPTGVASAVLGVFKVDAGTWVLGNTANTYTGTTMVSGGRLVGTDSLSLPTTSPLVLANGVFQSNGSFTRATNASPLPGTGGVSWATSQGAVGGGFAAGSAKLTVNLGPSAALTWGAGGFASNTGSAAASGVLILNSTTALAEVEFQNAIDLGGVNRTVQVDDNGTTTTDFATLSGVLSGATSGTAGSGLVKTGAGSLQLLGANTYSGATLLSAGSLYVQSIGSSTAASSNLGGPSAVLRLGGGTLVYAGAGESSNRAIALNASTTLEASGSGALILNGSVTSPGSAARTLTLQGVNTDANEIASVLVNPTENATTLALSVTKAGAGTWILSGASTHTGTTSVTNGALGIGNNAALGTGTLTLTNGSIFADGGARTITNLLNLNNGTGAVIGVNSLTVNGPAQFNGGTYTLNNFLTAPAQFEITGTLTNSDAGTARTFAVGGTGRTLLSGTIQEISTSAASLTINSGTVVLGAAAGNTYSGATTINGGTVQLAGGSGNLIPDGAGKGNVTIANTTIPVILDLNGQTETINGLTAVGTGVRTIDNNSATAVTLTFGNNNGPVNFVSSAAGGITQSNTGTISIVKTGTAAGVINVFAAGYTGTTEVQTGGSLSFTNGTPTATTGITVAGGAGLAFNNGLGQPISALTLLNLGGGAGTTTLGLDLGTTSDTLTTSGAATTANTILFDLIGVSGFGAGTYDLLLATGGLFGPTYGLSSVPGGFSYLIDVDPLGTYVRLNATALGPQTFNYTADQDNSWATFNLGNTNWAVLSGPDFVEAGSTPGPLDTVVFSATGTAAATLPAGPAILTTLDNNFTIDHLVFNGQTSSAGVAAAVSIAAGAGGTLTLSPVSSSDGISVPNASGTASIGAPLNLGTDQTWTTGTATGNLGSVLTVGSVISGPGNLTKAGLGSATITGNNTRTGKTAINAGTLIINAEAALGVNPGAATADQLSFDGGILRFSVATLIDDTNRGITLNAGGGTIDNIAQNGTIASTVPIVGGGALTKIGGNMLVINSANGYSGGTLINGGVLRAGNSTALGTGGVGLNASGVVLELDNAVNMANAIGVLDTGNEKTLRLLTGATSGEFSGAITVTETSAGNFRVSAAAGGTLTISGAVTEVSPSVAGIRKEGAGTVILTNAASVFRGPSSVAAGILQHGASNILASTTAVTVHGTGGVAATLDLNGFNQSVGTITYNGVGGAAGSANSVTTGAGVLTLGGNVTVNANGNPTTPALLSGNVVIAATRTFTVADSTGSVADLTVSAAISSTGTAASGITKSGAGTMDLSGANTYTGVTTVTAGVLRNAANDVIPGAVTVNAPATGTTATYDLNGFNETVGTLTFGGTSTITGAVNSVTTGAGTLTLGASVVTNAPGAGNLQASLAGNVAMPATTTYTVANVAAQPVDLSVSANVSGAGGLTKAGLGTMVLSGANTYTGKTAVNAGVLSISSDGNLGAAPGVAVADQLSIAGGATLQATGSTTLPATRGVTVGPAGTSTFEVTGANALSVSGAVAGTGGVTKTGTGTLEFSGSVPNTYSGVTTVTNGTLDLNKSAGTNAVVGDGASIKATADVIINGGTVRLLADDQLADSVTIDISSGTMDFNNRNEVLFNLINSGGTVNYGAGDVTIDDPTWSGGTNTISGNTTFGSLFISGGTNTVNGFGGGPTAGRLRIGTVTTPGPIDFTGSNNTPSLALNSDNATPGTLQFAAGLNVSLTFTGTGTSTGTISNAGAGTNKGRVDLNGSTRTFDIGDAAGSAVDMTIGADIIDSAAAAAGVDKIGAGTLLLSGTTTYTGDTNINAGTVLVTGSVTGSVNANNTGTLGGTGSVGNLHVFSGGTVSPGTSIGMLTAAAAIMDAGSNFMLEVSPSTLTNDKLVVTNSVILDLVTSPTLAASIDGPDMVLTIGTTLPFITYTTFNGGLFQVLGTPINQYNGDPNTTDFFVLGGNSFAIDYTTGNTITLVAVPEPGVGASLLGGFGLLVGLQRRRRR